MMQCKKYILDLSYPEDTHYLSHVDGRLHVISTAQPFNHDEYCMEFENISGDVQVSYVKLCYKKVLFPDCIYYVAVKYFCMLSGRT